MATLNKSIEETFSVIITEMSQLGDSLGITEQSDPYKMTVFITGKMAKEAIEELKIHESENCLKIAQSLIDLKGNNLNQVHSLQNSKSESIVIKTLNNYLWQY